MESLDKKMEWFVDARYGMFVHFGVYSMLGRGEWAMNRERIPPDEYRQLANQFNPVNFDADALCQLAVDGGMKYIVFTTMHHDGFRLYDSSLTDFCSTKLGPGRDFTAEMVAACRRHGLRIGLYHSLNNWFDQPDGAAALEDAGQYRRFIDNTFARIRELLVKYNPVDILWYDGWWPFHAKGWQSERMNEMARAVQPGLIINGRNGLPGDYATPEGHMTAPSPWRPWEACMTLNDHWGHHPADHNWKSPLDVVKMLAIAANHRGNLLLNIGPDGSGATPEESARTVRQVGAWLRGGGGGEAILHTDTFTFDYERRGGHRSDWDGNAVFTARGNCLNAILKFFPGPRYTLCGVEPRVERITVAGGPALPFTQTEGRVAMELPESLAARFCPVLRLECDGPPSIHRCGGMRVPAAPHPPYDPCPSDLVPGVNP